MNSTSRCSSNHLYRTQIKISWKQQPYLRSTEQVSVSHAVVVNAELVDTVDIWQLELGAEDSSCNTASSPSQHYNTLLLRLTQRATS